MSAEQKWQDDPHIRYLVTEGEKILHSPERVLDLAGRRAALRMVDVEDYFRDHTFRLGIVGNPNRGKTTYAYSLYTSLKDSMFPAHYVDLDIYSQSGPAIAGRIAWDERPKRNDAPKRDVMESLRKFKNVQPGLVIADFPGRADNPYQPRRAKALDMAVLLGDDPTDRDKWMRILEHAHKPYLWMRTRPDGKRTYPLDPTIYHLDREPKPHSLDITTSQTRILEVIANMRDIPLHDIWKMGIFTEPERMILEEVLDFEFAPYAKGYD